MIFVCLLMSFLFFKNHYQLIFNIYLLLSGTNIKYCDFLFLIKNSQVSFLKGQKHYICPRNQDIMDKLYLKNQIAMRQADKS